MRDLLYLVPLLLGAALLVLGIKTQAHKDTAMNRALLGISLLGTSLLFWLSSAMLPVEKGQFYFIFNMAMVYFFFSGLASFLPRSVSKPRPDQPHLPGGIFHYVAFAAGLAHASCMMLVPAWSAYLLQLYGKLGFHGAMLTTP